MPKKTKKGKSKSKEKSKSKKGDKAKDKDTVVKSAVANAHLWEGKLHVSERTKQEYRESAKKLLTENEQLQNQMLQTERDTVEVVAFLKKEDLKKDEQIDRMQQIIKELKRDTRKEKQSLIDNYTQKIHDLQDALTDKSEEVKLMQSELKMVKEFEENIKDALFQTEKQHKTTLSHMEHKFFEEKMRLQQEASKKIAELAEQAHVEAVSNLDETTKAVYKENIRLNEALAYHLNETKNLEKINGDLKNKNKSLQGEEELNSLVVQEKVVQAKQYQKQNKELQEKVESLEKTLSQMVKEFEDERNRIMQHASTQSEQSKMELARLHRTVELKTREMNRVKKLAKNILDERSEIEQFFLDSLEYVKNEIIRNRKQYKKEAQMLYQNKMLAAHAGKSDYPKIRNFLPIEHSTNSVFSDMKEAESFNFLEGKVDIGDLTWEQRERVLRLLFAKLNGLKNERRKQQRTDSSLAIESAHRTARALERVKEDKVENGQSDESTTFITQHGTKVEETKGISKKAEKIELPPVLS
eukprot:gene17759-19532_t